VIEADCKDLDTLWAEDTCSLEIIIKKLSTALRCEGDEIYQPVGFELLGIHLQREYFGAKLSGSRFQWIPQIEDAILYLLSSTRSQNLK
jgi:hypothetical protein